MKSLNRTLSLVLVLAMVLGLMGIASAATFTDDSTIQYKEAVGVMTGIGAINGYTDGTFKPTGTITREEAAKLVTYSVLGADIAKTLSVTTSSFSDVASNRWSAPYIAYLVSKGIINGVGEGKFNPTGNVTGYQLAKMLLCAAGYGVNGEYVGDSWELNVAIDASRNGVFTGSKATSFSTAATREEAALYCFNGITRVCTVKYSKDTSSYVKNLGTSAGNPRGTTDISIATLVYPTLVNNATGTDAYGRPANTWSYKGKVITLAATATPVLTYSAAVSPAAIKLALTNLGYTLPTGATATFWTNGVAPAAYSSANVATYFSNTGYVGGNGCIAEIYVTSAGVLDRVVVINTHLASVSLSGISKDVASTTTVDERELRLSLNGHTITATPATTTGFDAAYAAAAAEIAAGRTCALLVVPTNDATANGVALSIAVPTTVTGTITKSTSAGVYTIGGKDYKISAEGKFSGTQLNVGTTATYILDTYGNLIAATSVSTTTANYGYLLEYAAVDYAAATLTKAEVPAAELVKFVDATGAVKTLSTNFTQNATTKVATFVLSGNGNGSFSDWSSSLKGILFSYTLDAAGKISAVSAVGSSPATEDKTITKGSATFDDKYLTDSTVVFYFDGTNVAVYKGYNNVITKATTANSSIMNASPADSSYAALLVTVGAVAPTSTSSYAYFASLANTTEVTATGATITYTDVYLDGVKGSLTFASDPHVTAKHLYTYSLTSGVASVSDTSASANVISSLQSGYFVMGSTPTVVYTSAATKYYVIDFTNEASGVITVNSAAAIQALGATYSVNAFYVANGSASVPATVVYYYIGAPVA